MGDPKFRVVETERTPEVEREKTEPGVNSGLERQEGLPDLAGLSAELKKLEEKSLSSKEVAGLFARIEVASENESERDALVATILERTISRITREVGAGNLSAYNRAFSLLDHDPNSRTNKILRRSRDKAMRNGIYKAGVYNPISGKLNVIPEPEGSNVSEARLVGLALDGYDERDSTLHHELIHSFQDLPNPDSSLKIGARAVINRVSQGFRTAKILREIHAHRGEKRFTMPQTSREDFATLHRYKAIKNRGDIRKMLVAINQVDALYALGKTDQEIGDLIRIARWDKTKRTFDTLSRKIEELVAIKRLSRHDLRRMIAAEHLKAQIRTAKVKLIAQEEIAKSAGESHASQRGG